MLKMRVYIRKLCFVAGALFAFWLVISFYYLMQDTTVLVKPNALDLETRIESLQKKMDSELRDSSMLLDKVKHHIKKTESAAKENRRHIVKGHSKNSGKLILPILVIACDRVTVSRCLDNLVKFRPDKETFPIVVSQDCGHKPTYQMIQKYVDEYPSISVVQQPDLTEVFVSKTHVKFRGYYKIARHYKFALNHVFHKLGHEAVVIVEDDLDISPDFFEYFLGTYPLLQKDPSLWCISAWNDNGKKDVIDKSHPELLHRTDFFPGLGWMLRKESWDYLEPNWPKAFFDDWLRNPENTKGRACIRPEVSRTYSFGKIGVSKGLYFDMHLRHMQLNLEFVEFTKLNLTYLLKDRYDDEFVKKVYNAPQVSVEDVLAHPGGGDAVRVPYRDAKTFQKAAKRLGLMDDFRSGIPRTAYIGVVSFYFRNRRVYLAPDFTWTKYDPSWG